MQFQLKTNHSSPESQPNVIRSLKTVGYLLLMDMLIAIWAGYTFLSSNGLINGDWSFHRDPLIGELILHTSFIGLLLCFALIFIILTKSEEKPMVFAGLVLFGSGISIAISSLDFLLATGELSMLAFMLVGGASGILTGISTWRTAADL